MDADAPQASILHQAALDDPREQSDVDISAADQNADILSAKRNFLVQHRGGANCARAFGERLFFFEHNQNGVGDFFVIDGDDIVDILLRERKSNFAGASHGDAVGDGFVGGQGDQLVLLESGFHGRELGGLNTDHSRLRAGFFHRASDAADEASAAYRDDDSIQIALYL